MDALSKAASSGAVSLCDEVRNFSLVCAASVAFDDLCRDRVISSAEASATSEYVRRAVRSWGRRPPRSGQGRTVRLPSRRPRPACRLLGLRRRRGRRRAAEGQPQGDRIALRVSVQFVDDVCRVGQIAPSWQRRNSVRTVQGDIEGMPRSASARRGPADLFGHDVEVLAQCNLSVYRRSCGRKRAFAGRSNAQLVGPALAAGEEEVSLRESRRCGQRSLMTRSIPRPGWRS